MRHLSFTTILFFLCSCGGGKPIDSILSKSKTSRFVTTFLHDSLGSVSFLLPNQFDTAFDWTNRSDCGKPCDNEQYRFQPRDLPVSKESGIINRVPDSINQFTIIHRSFFPFRNDSDTSLNLGDHEQFKEALLKDPRTAYLRFDTIEKINDRYFSVFFTTGALHKNGKLFAKVIGRTNIKGNDIEFHYDLYGKDTTQFKRFFQSSLDYLRTVRLSNGI